MERLVWTTPTIEMLRPFRGLPFRGSDTSWVNLFLLRRKYKLEVAVHDGMSRRWVPFDDKSPTDFKALLKDCDAHGAILIAADDTQEIEGAQCITPKTIGDAHKGFDCVVIGYEQSLLELREKETACLELLFDTMELVREGGRVIIPRSTYRYLSYGRQGAEQLMLVKGLALEHISASQTDAVIGVRQREKSDFTWHHQQAWKERLT